MVYVLVGILIQLKKQNSHGLPDLALQKEEISEVALWYSTQKADKGFSLKKFL